MGLNGAVWDNDLCLQGSLKMVTKRILFCKRASLLESQNSVAKEYLQDWN